MSIAIERAIASRDKMQPGSDRNFGLVFAIFFAIVWLWPIWHGNPPRWWALWPALAFLVVALLVPKILWPLNYLWFRIGGLMHVIANPVLMGLIFTVAVVPTGFLMRLFGLRPLALRWEPDAKTYWIARKLDARSSDGMHDQY